MKRGLLSFLLLLFAAGIANAQGPDDLNAGQRLTRNASDGSFTFSWWGRSGKTYFIQQTDNLLMPWSYVPIIETGTDDVIAWGFSTTSDKMFLRLEIHDAAGALPDGWQMLYFGYLGVDPNALAPRGDGLTNLQAFLQGLNPVDYYNGVAPQFTIVGGNNQTGTPGGYLLDPLVVRVTDANGNPLVNAPVTFTVTQNGGLVANYDFTGASASCVARTDANGQAVVQFNLSSTAGTTSQITATAVTASVVFSETTNSGGGSGSQSSIQSLTTTLNADGSVDLSWVNNSTNTNAMTVKIRKADGTWNAVSVPAGTTSYHFPAAQ
jgi:hypothetical protein